MQLTLRGRLTTYNGVPVQGVEMEEFLGAKSVKKVLYFAWTLPAPWPYCTFAVDDPPKRPKPQEVCSAGFKYVWSLAGVSGQGSQYAGL